METTGQVTVKATNWLVDAQHIQPGHAEHGDDSFSKWHRAGQSRKTCNFKLSFYLSEAYSVGQADLEPVALLLQSPSS